MADPYLKHVSVNGTIFELKQRGSSKDVGSDGYITIVQPSSSEDGVHTPASSVIFYVTGQTEYSACKPVDDLIAALIEYRLALAKTAMKNKPGRIGRIFIGKWTFEFDLEPPSVGL